MTLYEINQEITDIVESIYSHAEENEGEIPDSLAEQLDRLESDRSVKIENIVLFIKNIRAESDAIKSEEKKLSDRRKSNDNKADSLEEYIKFCLSGEVFKTAKCAVSYRKSESVEVDSVDDLPANFVRTKTVVEADKVAIKNAIKAGEEISGAHLVSKNSIVIK